MADTVQGHEAVGGASARGKPDTSVKTPPAVKAAADRANALSAQAKAAKEANAASGADQPIGASGVNAPSGDTKPRVNAVVTNYDPNNPAPPPEPTLAPGTQTVLPP